MLLLGFFGFKVAIVIVIMSITYVSCTIHVYVIVCVMVIMMFRTYVMLLGLAHVSGAYMFPRGSV